MPEVIGGSDAEGLGSDGSLLERAFSPKRVTTDEGTVEERSVSEQIEALRYNTLQSIGDGPLHGLRISRCKPRGAV